ncbi:Hypothetical predicted protein, partial [Mytilus galloprovincialis]
MKTANILVIALCVLFAVQEADASCRIRCRLKCFGRGCGAYFAAQRGPFCLCKCYRCANESVTKIDIKQIAELSIALSTKEEKKERVAVSGFCEAILSTAEFEFSPEDILDKKAAEAEGAVLKMKLIQEADASCRTRCRLKCFGRGCGAYFAAQRGPFCLCKCYRCANESVTKIDIKQIK